MNAYTERQLSKLHYVAVENNFPNKFITFVITTVLAVLLPYVHLGIFYMKIWTPDKPQIDRDGCSCSCFDTVFRGAYENPGNVKYKHVYFNATDTSLKIWLFTIVFLLLFYESLRYLVGLFRSGAPLRRSMLFLYLVNIYPHYYSWWSFFSYYNEELYTYFIHHLMFTVTEILVTAIVLNMCNRNNEVSSWKIAIIVTISLVHIIVSGMDQFIKHVVYGEGRAFQNARNLGLMTPDLLHVMITLWEFYLHVQQQKLRLSELCFKEEIILMFVFITLGTVFGRLI